RSARAAGRFRCRCFRDQSPACSIPARPSRLEPVRSTLYPRMSTVIQPGAAESTSQTVAAAPPVPVIELQGLSVRFGKRDILKDLTCSLRGRAIGLLGPNGA